MTGPNGLDLLRSTAGFLETFGVGVEQLLRHLRRAEALSTEYAEYRMIILGAHAMDIADDDHHVHRDARDHIGELIEIGVDDLVALLHHFRADFLIQARARIAQDFFKTVSRIALVALDELKPFIRRALNGGAVGTASREYDLRHNTLLVLFFRAELPRS